MSDVFLGAIALATLVMAAVQVGTIVYAGRLARRLEQVAARIERDLKPSLDHLATMSTEAARAASLAVAQLERADRLFADFARRADDTLTIVQQAVIAPVREGMALVQGLRASFAALRHLRPRPQQAGRAEDEDALFIG